jgi:hypothetical protein
MWLLYLPPGYTFRDSTRKYSPHTKHIKNMFFIPLHVSAIHIAHHQVEKNRYRRKSAAEEALM